MGKDLQKIGILLGAILLSMIALTVFSASLLTNVTNPATQTFASQVTTGSEGTDLTWTLTGGPHWFTDFSEMTITGATSGAITTTNSTLTLDATRTIITFDAPTGATVTEDVTVAYVTEDTAAQGTTGWKLVPLFLILMALSGIVGAVFVGTQQGRTGNIAGLLVSIGVLFIGVILGEVVKSFTDDAIALYDLQPDYTGVGSLLPLIDLGYVFALFGVAVGGAIGFGTRALR